MPEPLVVPPPRWRTPGLHNRWPQVKPEESGGSRHHHPQSVRAVPGPSQNRSRRPLNGPHWQRKGDLGSSLRTMLRPDPATMGFYKSLADGQAEPHSARPSAGCAPKKLIKNAVQFLRWNFLAAVSDPNLQLVIVKPGVNCNRRIAGRILQRVVEQVH